MKVKLSSDSLWLAIDKILQLTSSLIIGVLLARYLGVELFGKLNYIIGIASIFWAFSKFGLDNVVIDELVKTANKSSIIYSAFLIKLFFSIFVTTLLYVISEMFFSNNITSLFIVFVTAGSIFQSLEVIDFYNQSINKNVYSAIARIFTLILLISVRLLGIYLELDLSFFVYSYFLEKVILAFFYLITNKYNIIRAGVTFDRLIIKRLIIRSLPLSFSSMMVILYMKVDMIMLEHYYGVTTVGIYSVASRIIDVVYIFPALIMTAMMPKLIKINAYSYHDFELAYVKLFKKINIVAIVSILCVYFFGQTFIENIFGYGYKDAYPILLILIASSFFGMSGIISSRWFVIKNLQKYTLTRTFIGLIINVILNYILIPKHGAIGAAFATLASQFIASYFINLFSNACRPLFIMQTKSFLFIK